MRDFGRDMTPPVREGDEFDVTIEAVGDKGDGVAKKDGFVLFVPNTRTGDNVRIKITRVLKSVGFAEVVGQGSGSGSAAPSARRSTPEPKPKFEAHEELDSEEFGD